MRTKDSVLHMLNHTGLTGVGADQHHLQPANLEISNTSLVVYPLPGGPYDWDIAIPYDTVACLFQLRSAHVVELAGATAGVVGVATRSSLWAATASVGGDTSITQTAYAAIYSKAAAAMNLSHKIFSSAGDAIALTEAYIVTTGPSTRKLRLTFTNYGASLKTLNCWGEVALLS